MPMRDYSPFMSVFSEVLSPKAGSFAVRLGVDPSTGHGCFPPQITTAGSVTCFTNMIAQNRMTDPYTGHVCGPTFHGAAAANGSRTVYFDQLRMHRNGDPITCGDMASAGSMDVFGGMS